MDKYKEAIRNTMERYDYILETHRGCDFTEIIGSIGGDIERVRVYKDGTIGIK